MTDKDTDDTDEPTRDELETRVEQLEQTVQQMLPSRRDALKLGGTALAAGALGSAATGSASAGTNSVGTIGSASSPVDAELEDVNPGSVRAVNFNNNDITNVSSLSTGSLNNRLFLSDYGDSGDGTFGNPYINALSNLESQESAPYYVIWDGVVDDSGVTFTDDTGIYIVGYGAGDVRSLGSGDRASVLKTASSEDGVTFDGCSRVIIGNVGVYNNAEDQTKTGIHALGGGKHTYYNVEVNGYDTCVDVDGVVESYHYNPSYLNGRRGFESNDTNRNPTLVEVYGGQIGNTKGSIGSSGVLHRAGSLVLNGVRIDNCDQHAIDVAGGSWLGITGGTWFENNNQNSDGSELILVRTMSGLNGGNKVYIKGPWYVNDNDATPWFKEDGGATEVYMDAPIGPGGSTAVEFTSNSVAEFIHWGSDKGIAFNSSRNGYKYDTNGGSAL